MLKIYLAGEIHTNWREEIIENCKKENLDIQFSSPVTDHPSSDDCGVEILGAEEKNFWKDRKGANINTINGIIYVSIIFYFNDPSKTYLKIRTTCF